MRGRKNERTSGRADERTSPRRSSYTHTLIPSYTLPALLLLGACAQAFPPPGGDPDKAPPRIIETIPAQNAVVPDFAGPAHIKFDETVSEKGPRKGEEVSVSPETGEVTIDRSGKELKVSIKGGWQKGRVYHVAVLPGFLDRHGNARQQAYELVFSTGAEILPTAVGGAVTDRLTGRAVANARIVAVGADSLAYSTSTDTAGFFAMQSLPLGTYNMTAYLDVNRNRKIDFSEAKDTKRVSIVAVKDTPVVEFSVLSGDSTPARLLRAEARDSLQVRIFFDDFIEATTPLAAAAVIVAQLPDSTLLPLGVLLHPHEFTARRAAAAPRDTTAKLPLVIPGAVAKDSAKILPTQDLVWVPSRPLTPKTRYRVTVRAIRDISGIENGGGTAVFETPAAPRAPAPAPARRDTTGAKNPPPVKPDATARPAKPDTTAHIRRLP